MKRSSLLAGSTIAALTVGLSLGAAGAAHAATTPAAASQSVTRTAPAPIVVTFSLLVPNAPVTFSVAGTVVGTGTTNSNGDVTFSYTPTGLAPGYYRLTATTSYGISSSVAFGVR